MTTAKIVVPYNPNKSHTRYVVGKKRVPGVTTIISDSLGWNKQVLMNWAVKVAKAGEEPDAIRDEAGRIGTLAHFMAECHVKGKLEGKNYIPDTSNFTANDIDKAENGFLGFLEWEERYNPIYVGCEDQFVCESQMFGGTLDTRAVIRDSLTLLDLKTSKGVYIDHIIQVAAYKFGYEDATGEKFSGVQILKINKEDGSFEHHPISDAKIQLGWLIFMHCRALYELKKVTEKAMEAGEKINPNTYLQIQDQARHLYNNLRKIG